MIEKLAETMLRFKENTAYVCKNEKLSFGELYNRARDFAEKLKNDDFSPVAVIGGRNADTMAAILGCVFAKRAYVPIDISLPEERKNRIISLSKAGTVIDCSKEKPAFEK
ncbi:MAG: AMP-binding protein, partial [Oscillospiraceae bacterium]|nr:AMP-binding protein [Oscillospiraceae bacterium]